MEYLLNHLANQNYLYSYEIDALRETFVLLMLLPLVATITGIARYIIGLKSLSVYAPIVLTYAFYELGYIAADQKSDIFRGLKFGLVLYSIVFIVSMLLYKLLRDFRMHYVPKTTIVMIGVSVSIVLAIFIGTLLFERKGLIYLDIFSVIMIATLSDTFVSLAARKHTKHTFFVGLQTLFTALVSYSIITLNQTENIVVNYTIILILVLVLTNIYIGKYVGLRILEYWRFRELLLQPPTSKNARQNIPNKKK